MDENYMKSLAEVYSAIENLDFESRNKISKKLIQSIENKMDRRFYLSINVDDEYIDTKMSEDAKQILALIYRDYLTTPEERAELLRQEEEEERRLAQKYDPNNLFNNNNNNVNTNTNINTNIQETPGPTKVEELSLTKIEKKPWYKNMIDKILNIFKK